MYLYISEESIDGGSVWGGEWCGVFATTEEARAAFEAEGGEPCVWHTAKVADHEHHLIGEVFEEQRLDSERLAYFGPIKAF